jgi:phage terminase large subunit
VWDKGEMNKHDWVFTFPNGSTITMIGLDAEDGLERAHGMGSDRLYYNECTEIDYDVVEQANMRCKGQVIYDFNPKCAEDFWIYVKILNAHPDEDSRNPEAIRIHSTYKDNPFISDFERQDIEKLDPDNPINVINRTADKTKWLIYGKGIRAQMEGLVFDKWEIVNEFPTASTKVGLGLDWGYSHFKTALMRGCFYQNAIYYQELVYETGLAVLHNKDLPDRKSLQARMESAKVSKTLPMWADSSNPSGIDDLRLVGYNCRRVDKPPGSILAGIELMQRYPMKIVRGSDHMIYELERYTWRKDRHNKPMNEPVDNWNDAIDASRYLAMNLGITPEGTEDIPGIVNVHPKDPAARFDYNNGNSIRATDDETITMSRGNFGDKRYKPVFQVRYNGDFDDFRRRE